MVDRAEVNMMRCLYPPEPVIAMINGMLLVPALSFVWPAGSVIAGTKAHRGQDHHRLLVTAGGVVARGLRMIEPDRWR